MNGCLWLLLLLLAVWACREKWDMLPVSGAALLIVGFRQDLVGLRLFSAASQAPWLAYALHVDSPQTVLTCIYFAGMHLVAAVQTASPRLRLLLKPSLSFRRARRTQSGSDEPDSHGLMGQLEGWQSGDWAPCAARGELPTECNSSGPPRHAAQRVELDRGGAFALLSRPIQAVVPDKEAKEPISAASPCDVGVILC